MTFRATNVVPEAGYRTAKTHAVTAKQYAQRESNRLATQDVNADRILAIFHDCRRLRDELSAAKDVPNILAYARDQENDQTYDLVAEFNALIAALQAVMDDIETTFPTNASGYLLEKQFNAQGTYDFRQFTIAQTANIRTLLDAVVAQVS